jgi:hypothetical protein
MITYKQYLDEIFIEDPAVVNQAKKTFAKQKQASLEKQKQLTKAAGAKGAAGSAARERLKLLKQLYTKLNDPKTDEEVLSVAGMESQEITEPVIEDSFEDTFIDYLEYIEESSNFIKSLTDKGVTKSKAEKAWYIATKSFKTGKFKKVKGARKYKIIAGLAKKIALKEDGTSVSMSPATNGVADAAINTTSLGNFTFAAKLGEPVNEPGKYSPNASNIFTRYNSYGGKKKKRKRKVRKESIDINNFVDKLFE